MPRIAASIVLEKLPSSTRPAHTGPFLTSLIAPCQSEFSIDIANPILRQDKNFKSYSVEQIERTGLLYAQNLVQRIVEPGVGVGYLNPGCFINAVAPNQAFFNAAPPFECDTTTIPLSSLPTGTSPLTCTNLLGNLRCNSITGPGLFNVDFSLVKDTHVTKISEAFDIQFRAEFFDFLNHPNFAPPVDNLEPIDANGQPVQDFGVIDSTLPNAERRIQVGLKIIF